MNGGLKKCPKGHYYEGESCPYCKTRNEGTGSGTIKTEIFIDPYSKSNEEELRKRREAGYGLDDPTFVERPISPTKTVFGDDQETFVNPPSSSGGANTSRTVFGSGSGTLTGDPDEIGPRVDNPAPGNKAPVNNPYRTERKLVGWLVSYTLDAMGVDFKLYEGRNIIGRDADCNITIPDPMMSAKHAVLLFRANKYSLTDSQSSHGTFVNDADIELEPCYLNDGDIIRMGKTIFKFRTSF